MPDAAMRPEDSSGSTPPPWPAARAERQSYATLWVIARPPLYTGDDLTRLDSYGLPLLTNKKVIALDQGAPPPGR